MIRQKEDRGHCTIRLEHSTAKVNAISGHCGPDGSGRRGDEIAAGENARDRLRLNRRRLFVTHLPRRLNQVRMQTQFLERHERFPEIRLNPHEAGFKLFS